MNRNIILGMALLMLLILAGCSDMGDPVTTAPGGQISYASQIQPIFNQNCGCHITGTFPKNLHLNSYATLMAVPPDPNAPVDAPVVIPGQPDSSHLYLRLTGVEQPQMPFGGPYLSDDLLNTVYQWIEQGAQNN